MSEPTTDYDDMLFSVRRSVRYHMHRTRFYDNFHSTSTALSVMLGVSAVYSALSASVPKEAIAIIAAIISATGVLDLVIGTTQKARMHNSLANKFLELEKQLLSAGEAGLQSTHLQRLELEKDEPPVLDVLNVICHNEIMTAMGYPKEQQAEVTGLQRFFSPFFDYRPHSIQ